jgi:hypothetical protein
MQMHPFRLRVFSFVAGLAVMAFSGWAAADPPSRVARLGYMTGAVSFSPAGANDWVRAAINRPLTTGDRLWVDADSRAEIQVGGAMIRMSAGTGVSILNLDDRITQLQLTQGALNVRVRRLELDQVLEVDTPNLAFTVRQPGEYRIAVYPDGSATTIVVRKGQGEVYGEGAAYVVDSRQPYRFAGTGLREYQYVEAPRFDEFDRWSSDRDRSFDASVSARYVSQDVVGYQDLDAQTQPTAMSGSRAASLPTGRPTATDTGHGSIPGAGRGWMTRPGDSPCPITAAGRISAAPGVGYRVPCAPGPTTLRHWSCSWAAATSSSRSPAATSAASRGSRSGRARSIDRRMR